MTTPKLSLLRHLIINFKNILGWTTKQKYVVFESDDWGSIRIPNQKTYKSLLESNIIKAQNPYDKYDALESADDLELLFEVLASVKDESNNSAVYTPFFNTANPNYEKIKSDNFKNYYYEPFFREYEKRNELTNLKKLIDQGIGEKVFMPQFHGREHLAVQKWLAELRSGNEKVLKAFDLDYNSVPLDNINPKLESLRIAFLLADKSELKFLGNSIREGVKLFEEFFGYVPTVFDPPNGVFPIELEEVLNEVGIRTIVTQRFRSEPLGDGKFRKKYYRFGGVNKFNQLYHIRNCQFEAMENKLSDHCMKYINAAFRWGKPAVITSHRINFVGGFDKNWRDENLKELKVLLNKIKQVHPDVRFISSGELSAIMQKRLLNDVSA